MSGWRIAWLCALSGALACPPRARAGRDDAWLRKAYESPYPVAVSVHGDRIAVERRRGDTFELSVVNAVSRDEQLVDSAADPQLDPALSPDGEHLAFFRSVGGGAFRLHVHDVRGGTPLAVEAPLTRAAVTPIPAHPSRCHGPRLRRRHFPRVR